ncbi:type II toxin-antitoxin system RelE/ParE family toxin [Luteolibacter pohnpeiensis]|uniref:Type II toxin-antitoxin system RelE/ParE family toxin n=1 Tax=Luteolibacter pohnpeiensis TaxID=454153 RepID=A0A934SCA5_9BACT|nr:type II toxin-antitoxin system RelE/ParE family toxin [Luteolibacter pohnpeiensis]MBK1883527.1 type II toxin-antitoxin system RelE/ParE family toxin [Luteolibacter pohnpeiensis]
MKPFRLVLTESAEADLRGIHDYIANEKASPVSAERFTRDLIEQLFEHAGKGLCGSPRDEVSPGLRGLPYRGRCFYFRVVEDSLVVVRVLNSKQDVAAQEFPEI